jgi:hypothetical protein
MELAKEVVRGIFDESRDYQRQALSITTEIEEAAATGDDTAAAMKRKEYTLKASKDLERWR